MSEDLINIKLDLTNIMDIKMIKGATMMNALPLAHVKFT